MSASVLRADARCLPLAADSVDLVVTSPPYFALRSYQDGGEHYAGQIGDEPTPAEFVASLLEVTRECVRVLKPSGSLWVNLGDKYAGGGGHKPDSPSNIGTNKHPSAESTYRKSGRTPDGMRTKSLIGIPWRYALACIDDLGLILRAEVIWSKPNGLPESVTDRVRRSHEQWFHFTREPRYFSAVDELREPHIGGQTGLAATFARPRPSHDLVPGQGFTQHRADRDDVPAANPLGKLPGSVWTVPTEPLRVPDHLGIDHFAAFPTEWPKRIIQGWSPAGVCVECGEGRRPVGVSTITADRGGRQFNPASGNIGVLGKEREFRLTGYACACPEATWETSPDSGICANCNMPSDWSDSCSQGCERPSLPPTTPGVVLDPFGGTGTTALVASALGRHGITVDRSADYCRLGQWRTSDRNQRAKVLGVAKVEQQPVDQAALF